MMVLRVLVAKLPLPRGAREKKVEKAAGLPGSRLVRKFAPRLARWLPPPLGLVRAPMLLRALGPGWYLGEPEASQLQKMQASSALARLPEWVLGVLRPPGPGGSEEARGVPP